jgi:hypothetical protein
MTLLPDWKQIAKKAWSMWGNYITMALSGMEVVSVVFLNGTPSLGVTLAVFIVVALSTGARLIPQKGLNKGTTPVPDAMLSQLISTSEELAKEVTRLYESSSAAPVPNSEQFYESRTIDKAAK